ncbi:uncharacterized protein LOC127162649 isoform X2 [Labeo rohita]|uniref:uncharacterized protein LOC127162649 isoform X2 n=1 Tax=Labeo rohita TaxID=84645 RepID=UPI0021E1CA52|nr:uncharacterized protein LOC127162649 isoform X2 [Labeo rohita]
MMALFNFVYLKMHLPNCILISILLMIAYVSGSDESIYASVGEDVTLNCSVDSHFTREHIEEVSWKKTDKDEHILVLLYQNNKTLSDSAHERYRDRVEFFTPEIPKGNFSLRLKSVRTEDKGVYMCQVFAGGLSINTTVVLERLGFSVSHIMVLILCISASGSTLLLCWLIYCRSPNKGFTTKHSCNMFVPLGGSVVLPCHVEEYLLNQNLMVEWRRVDKVTLVHLYQDCKSGGEKQQQDYHDRANFFTDPIQHGNFSLCLDNLRAEDEGRYTSTVYSDQDCVYSSETNLVLRCSVGEFDPLVVCLGSSVVLPCYGDKRLLKKGLKVEWRRADSGSLVHLYQDGGSRLEEQHNDYLDRAHFFTDHIRYGNFSLRLDNLRAEDAGEYICKIYSDQDCVYSEITKVVLGFVLEHSSQTLVPLGSSVVLPCYDDKHLKEKCLKVEWRRADSETLVHLYQDGESRAEAQQQDYRDRAHFFTNESKNGNFSLRLDNMRAEDEGQYTCTIYSQENSVFSAKTHLVLRLLDLVFNLQMFLVFCPNIMMFLAFVLWGVSEGSLNETVFCCVHYLLRPLMLLWAAPYAHEFTGSIRSVILYYSYRTQYIVFSAVFYLVLFKYVWHKGLNYTGLDGFMITVLFLIVLLLYLYYTVFIFAKLIGKLNERAFVIFSALAGISFNVLPSFQFILLYYTFGSTRGDRIGWASMTAFLQVLWAVLNFTWSFEWDIYRVVPVYVFGSVGVVLLNAVALMTELILKTVNGYRTVEDLRIIVFSSEFFFPLFLLILLVFEPWIKTCLPSCEKAAQSYLTPASHSLKKQTSQNAAESDETPASESKQKQDTAESHEMKPFLNQQNQDAGRSQTQPDSVETQS